MKNRARKTGAYNLIVAVLVVFLVVPLVGIGCGGGFSTPQAAVSEMLKALFDKRDWSALRQTVLPERAREVTDEEDMQWREQFKELKEWESKLSDLKLQTKHENTEKTEATVSLKSGELTRKNPATKERETLDLTKIMPETYKVTKVKGKWYVDYPLSPSAIRATNGEQ